MSEIDEEFNSITSKEINELMHYVIDNEDNIPNRMCEVLVYGIAAAQLGEACDKNFKGEIDYHKSFEMAENSAVSIIPNSIVGKLRLYVQLGLASMRMSEVKDKNHQKSEKIYHSKLIDMFDIAFPYFDFIGSEVRPHDEDRDRIDILAKCKDSDRHAIIELKVGNKSGHKQLRSYAHGFNNPILINISEEEVKTKRDGIIYKTFDEIGIKL